MGIFLNLETGAGGTPEEAIEEARRASSIVRLWTKLNVNGVEVLIHPDDSLTSLTTNWRKALERGATFCSANVIPGPREEHLTPERPAAILAWAVATFGDYARKPDERARRLLEEVVELVQSLSVTKYDVWKIVERTYDRLAGDPVKELAQVGLTVECMAACLSVVDLSDAIDVEFARIRAKSAEHWKGRAAEKKTAGTEDVG